MSLWSMLLFLFPAILAAKICTNCISPVCILFNVTWKLAYTWYFLIMATLWTQAWNIPNIIHFNVESQLDYFPISLTTFLLGSLAIAQTHRNELFLWCQKHQWLNFWTLMDKMKFAEMFTYMKKQGLKQYNQINSLLMKKYKNLRRVVFFA